MLSVWLDVVYSRMLCMVVVMMVVLFGFVFVVVEFFVVYFLGKSVVCLWLIWGVSVFYCSGDHVLVWIVLCK